MHFRKRTGLQLAVARSRAGFTLVEFIVAAGAIAIFVAGAVVALTQINRAASGARLRTLALAVAQQRIDHVLTVPWGVSSTRPVVLTAGTRTEANLPLNNDELNSRTGLRSAFTNLDAPVNATRTTQITDLSARIVRAVVTVNFTYRQRPYSVQLTTIRTTDSI